MNNLAWYMNLYYKYRQYPAKSLNVCYKKNELKSVYNQLLKRLASYFQVSISKPKQYKYKRFDAHQLSKKISKNSFVDIQPINSSYIDVQSQYIPQPIYKPPKINQMQAMINLIPLLLKKLMVAQISLKQNNKNITTLGNMFEEPQKQRQLTLDSRIPLSQFPTSLDDLKFTFLQYCSKSYVNFQIPRLQKQSFDVTKIICKFCQNSFENFRDLLDEYIRQCVGLTTNEEQLMEKSKLNYVSLSGDSQDQGNILLTTWIEMMLLTENVENHYELICELIREKNKKQNPQLSTFRQRISSYLHLLLLHSCKQFFLRTLCYQNCLVIFYQVINNTRSIKDLQLKSHGDGVLIVTEKNLQQNIWIENSMILTMVNCRKINKMITQFYSKSKELFWAATFSACLHVLTDFKHIKVIVLHNLINIWQELPSHAPHRKELYEIIQQILFCQQDAIEIQQWEIFMKDKITLYYHYNSLLQMLLKQLQGDIVRVSLIFCTVVKKMKHYLSKVGDVKSYFQDFIREFKLYFQSFKDNQQDDTLLLRVFGMIIEVQKEILNCSIQFCNIEHNYPVDLNSSITDNYPQKKFVILSVSYIQNLIESPLVTEDTPKILNSLLDLLRFTNQINSRLLFISLKIKQQYTNFLDTKQVAEQIQQYMRNINNQQEISFQVKQRLRVHSEILKFVVDAINQCQTYHELWIRNTTANLTSPEHNQQYLAIYERIKEYIELYRIIAKNISLIFYNKHHQQKNQYFSMLQNIILKKPTNDLNIFQLISHYYRTMTETLKVNCFISSLHVNRGVFFNITNYQSLSNDRKQKLQVIGSKYYENVRQLQPKQIKEEITPDILKLAETKTLQGQLIVLISLIHLLYEQNMDCNIKSSKKLSELLRNYFLWRIYHNTDKIKTQQRESFDLNLLIQTVFEYDESAMKQHTQINYIQLLMTWRQNKLDQIQRQKLLTIIQNQSKQIKCFDQIEERVGFLQKKLFYLMLREIYFNLTYDCFFLQPKQSYSLNNYKLYEHNILGFFQTISKHNFQQFYRRKQYELKKRSVYLQNYLLQYEQQPANLKSIEKSLNRKLVAVFNQILCLATQERKVEIKKKSANNFVNTKGNSKEILPLYLEYLGKKYQTKQDKVVHIFTLKDYQMVRGLRNYEILLHDNCLKRVLMPSSIESSIAPFNIAMEKPITEQQLAFIKKNQNSLIFFITSEVCQENHKVHFDLVRKNLFGKIQKLYINLHVRHRIFESFKDRILNYEMQKAKIYHQYMDYIRGLKLDVYSHLGNEDPSPYLKLMSLIKWHRLLIKRQELQKKVDKQFGKNLQKWNSGIVKDLNSFDVWIQEQAQKWRLCFSKQTADRKALLQIHGIIEKQLVRQYMKKEKKEPSVSTLSRKNSSVHIRPLTNKSHSNSDFRLKQFKPLMSQTPKRIMTATPIPKNK